MTNLHAFPTGKPMPAIPTRQQPIIRLDITLPNGQMIDLTMVPEQGDCYTETPECVALNFPAAQQTVTFIKANLAAFSVKHTIRTVPDMTPDEVTAYLKTLDAA